MSIGQSGLGPQGLSQSALELLANPEKLKKTHASLKEAQKQAQDAIELAGPAHEIIQIRAEIEGELDKQRAATEAAERALEERIAEAETKADEIVAAAVEKGNGLVADAEKERQKVLDEATVAKSEIRNAEQGLVVQRDQITKAQDQLDAVRAGLDQKKADLDRRSDNLDQLKSSLLEEKTKLAEAREHLNKVLG